MPKVSERLGVFIGGHHGDPIGIELILVLESNREGFTYRNTGLVDADRLRIGQRYVE